MVKAKDSSSNKMNTNSRLKFLMYYQDFTDTLESILGHPKFPLPQPKNGWIRWRVHPDFLHLSSPQFTPCPPSRQMAFSR